MSDQPYPEVKPCAEAEDPRLTCWFCGKPAVVVAPRHSGGDMDVAAHWLPVCHDHAANWFESVSGEERLPIFYIEEKVSA